VVARHGRDDQHARRVSPVGGEPDQVAERPRPDDLLLDAHVERLLRIEPGQPLQRVQRGINGVHVAAYRGWQEWAERFERDLPEPPGKVERLQQALTEQVVKLVMHGFRSGPRELVIAPCLPRSAGRR
jgi:hypothetical protein